MLLDISNEIYVWISIKWIGWCFVIYRKKYKIIVFVIFSNLLVHILGTFFYIIILVSYRTFFSDFPGGSEVHEIILICCFQSRRKAKLNTCRHFNLSLQKLSCWTFSSRQHYLEIMENVDKKHLRRLKTMPYIGTSMMFQHLMIHNRGNYYLKIYNVL